MQTREYVSNIITLNLDERKKKEALKYKKNFLMQKALSKKLCECKK